MSNTVKPILFVGIPSPVNFDVATQLQVSLTLQLENTYHVVVYPVHADNPTFKGVYPQDFDFRNENEIKEFLKENWSNSSLSGRPTPVAYPNEEVPGLADSENESTAEE